MSGNSGSKRSRSLGGNSGGKAGADICILLVVETSLFSPDEEVIKTLKKGSVLNIVYSGTGNRIQAESVTGEVVGSLVGDKIIPLLRCIKDGHNYKGVVIEIQGGNCKIKISHT
jgi:hypothetical protein